MEMKKYLGMVKVETECMAGMRAVSGLLDSSYSGRTRGWRKSVSRAYGQRIMMVGEHKMCFPINYLYSNLLLSNDMFFCF